MTNLNSNYTLIQEPRRTKGFGAPDFKAFKNRVKIGFIETKDLNKNLDEEAKSEQIDRYQKSIDNLIFTNYSRFILIRNNQHVFDFELFSLSDLENSRFVVHSESIERLLQLFETFFDKYSSPTIKSASELSFELSKRTKLLKILAEHQLEDDIANSQNSEPVALQILF